jgi:hypothetical protein
MKTITFFFLLIFIPVVAHVQQDFATLSGDILVAKRCKDSLIQVDLDGSGSVQKLDNTAKISIDSLVMNKKDSSVYVCITGTLLYDKPQGNIVEPVKRNDTVYVLGKEDDFFRVNFRGDTGFVYQLGFKSKLELLREAALKIEKERQRKLAVIRKQKAEKVKALQRRKQLIDKYGLLHGNKIYQGFIWIGMTKEMLIDSWGEPEKIDTLKMNGKLKEDWVYYHVKHLYFVDGKLLNWTD